MQMYLMNEYVDEMKTGNLKKYDSVEYNKNCMLTTILRNLHREEHCQGCFKNCIECRMKQPSRQSNSTHFIWETKKRMV